MRPTWVLLAPGGPHVGSMNFSIRVNNGSGNGLVPSLIQQVITWANVDLDLCCHMPSLGHNKQCHWNGAKTVNPFPTEISLIQVKSELTYWGQVTHICVGNLAIIGSDNGLSPGRRQAIIWTNAGILSTGPLGTNFSEILIEIYTFSFKKIHLKMPSGKWGPSCLGLNELR